MRIRYFFQYLGGDFLGFVSRNYRNFIIIWVYLVYLGDSSGFLCFDSSGFKKLVISFLRIFWEIAEGDGIDLLLYCVWLLWSLWFSLLWFSRVNLGFVQEAGHRFFFWEIAEGDGIDAISWKRVFLSELYGFIFRNYCHSEFMFKMLITRKFLCPWQGLIWW